MRYNILKLLQLKENITDIKIKNLSERELIVALDRLTRFKYTEDKYLRVFKETILSNLIEPKFRKKDLDEMDYSVIKDYAQKIINSSIKLYCPETEHCTDINKKLYEYENKIFNLTENTNKLLKNEIDYNSFVRITDNTFPVNLQWLKTLSYNDGISTKIREEKSLKFPIEKVVIVEGITEETLLPVFAQKLGYDFYKKGVQVISAGGKNQVVKLFYTFAEQLKIPVFVLLDDDAGENYKQISLRLRPTDKIHLLKSGEFEDALPKELIVKTLNDYLRNLNTIDSNDFSSDRMVENLEEIFKKKGFHEFKKAEFAQMVKTHIDSTEDISDEIKKVINKISEVRPSLPQ